MNNSRSLAKSFKPIPEEHSAQRSMVTTQRAFRIESPNFRSRSSYSSQRRSSMKDWELLSQNKSLVRNILEIQSRKPLFSDIFGGTRNGQNHYRIVGHSRSHVNLSLNKDRVSRSFHVDLPKATLVLSNAHTNLFSRKTHVLQAHQENTRLVNRLNRIKPALIRSPSYNKPGSTLTSWNQSKIAASPQRCNHKAPIRSRGLLGLYQIQTNHRAKSSVIKLNKSLTVKRST